MKGAFAAVVFLSFGLRLWLAAAALPHSDELNLMRLVKSAEFRAGLSRLPAHGDQHPPGQVYWSALGAAVLGENLVGYRAASVLLGTAAVAACGLLAWEWFGARAALLAAALLGLNEYHLGVSAGATEKASYLGFAAIALLLVLRLTREESTRRWLGLGAAFGLGAATKQALWLWTAPAAAYLGAIRGFPAGRRRGPLLAAAVFCALVSVDVAWNFSARRTEAPASKGLAFQLGRLGVGTWSWAPSALYIRPLYYRLVEPALSEYASMTTVPGVLLLASALASLFFLKSREARFLQALGWGTFLFFSLCATPRGEFWWADLSLLPFVVLTGALWDRAASRRPALLALPVVLAAVPAALALVENDNYHPLDWGAPPVEVSRNFVSVQRRLDLRYADFDYARLTSLAGLALPARTRYERARAWRLELPPP